MEGGGNQQKKANGLLLGRYIVKIIVVQLSLSEMKRRTAIFPWIRSANNYLKPLRSYLPLQVSHVAGRVRLFYHGDFDN